MPRSVAICSRKHNVFELLGTALVNQNYAADAGLWLAVRNQSRVITLSDDDSAINMLHRVDPRNYRGKIGLGFNASRPIDGQAFVEMVGDRKLAVAIDAPAEVCAEIRRLIVASNDLELGVKQALRLIDMPFIVIAMTRSGLFAARSQGRQPLSVGRINNDIEGYYFASQSGVLGGDAQYIGSVLPGEMVFVNQAGVWRQMVNPAADQTRCLHEDLFKQKQDNISSGRPVSTVRQSVGRLMGRHFVVEVGLHRRRNAIVVQIPDGGLHYQIGFCDETGYQLDSAIIKNRYPLQGFGFTEEEIIRSKYNIIAEAVKKKKVIVVDDMVKGGGRMKYLARRMREAGALEIHGVVSGMLCYHCPYGNDDYTQHSEKEPITAVDLGLDSLTYPDKRDLLQILSTPDRPRCGNCLG